MYKRDYLLDNFMSSVTWMKTIFHNYVINVQRIFKN